MICWKGRSFCSGRHLQHTHRYTHLGVSLSPSLSREMKAATSLRPGEWRRLWRRCPEDIHDLTADKQMSSRLGDRPVYALPMWLSSLGAEVEFVVDVGKIPTLEDSKISSLAVPPIPFGVTFPLRKWANEGLGKTGAALPPIGGKNQTKRKPQNVGEKVVGRRNVSLRSGRPTVRGSRRANWAGQNKTPTSRNEVDVLGAGANGKHEYVHCPYSNIPRGMVGWKMFVFNVSFCTGNQEGLLCKYFARVFLLQLKFVDLRASTLTPCNPASLKGLWETQSLSFKL